jgi:hypothetical protein
MNRPESDEARVRGAPTPRPQGTSCIAFENIKLSAAAHAPANDALLHGAVRLCRSCGCETTADRICPDCAEALRVERAEALAEQCRRHGVKMAEDLPRVALAEHQAAWGRC